MSAPLWLSQAPNAAAAIARTISFLNILPPPKCERPFLQPTRRGRSVLHPTPESNFICFQLGCKKPEIAVTNVTLRTGIRASEQPPVIPCRSALKNCSDAVSFRPIGDESAARIAERPAQ